MLRISLIEGEMLERLHGVLTEIKLIETSIHFDDSLLDRVYLDVSSDFPNETRVAFH